VLTGLDNRRIDFSLRVGLVDTVVEATGGAMLIGTESARISDVKGIRALLPDACFSIEPAFLYLRQSAAHYETVVVPNFVSDFRRGSVRLYLTGGVGWLRFVQKFPGAPPGASRGFETSQWLGTFGFGTKFYLNDRWFVAPEFRIGLEPDARFSAGVGYRFRR
jgi:hypothetical protein